MTEDQRLLLKRAVESLAAAKILFANGFVGFSASRAYYVMFYVAEAFLAGIGRTFSKHSSLIAAFGYDFSRLGKVRRGLHGYLIEGQEVRNAGDYNCRKDITVEDARLQIDRAQEFLAEAERLIGPLPPPEPQRDAENEPRDPAE